MAATARRVAEIFNAADWPMSKEEVVAYAEQASHDEAVVRAVRGLPRGVHSRLEDVVSGVDTADTPGGDR